MNYRKITDSLEDTGFILHFYLKTIYIIKKPQIQNISIPLKKLILNLKRRLS